MVKIGRSFTKTEAGLLVLTAAFLLLIGGALLLTGDRPETADFRITTRRTADGPLLESAPEPPETVAETARVNINTASARELQSLPGIGPVLAERIVEHRETCGPFSCPEELLAVKGIGESLLDGMLDQITTEEQR